MVSFFFLNSFFPSKNDSWALARVVWPIQLGGQASAFFTKRNVPSIYGDDTTNCFDLQKADEGRVATRELLNTVD
jgi:hypothetical protein